MATDTDKDATELVTIPSETAREVFTDPAKLDVYLGQIRAIVDAFVMPDLSTVSGRDKVKSFAFRIVRSKTYLDLLAQREYQEAKKVPDLISKARKTIETKLDAWRDEVRKPVTEWEAKEKARVDRHNAALGQISRMGDVDGLTVEQIKSRLAEIDAVKVTDDDDFKEAYEAAKKRATAAVAPMLALREQYEKDQAELARLREAEQARQAEAAREREAAIRAAAAQDAKAAAAKKDAHLKAQIAALATVAADDEPETAVNLESMLHPEYLAKSGRMRQEARAIHPRVIQAFDEIDAAIFSGDTFHNPQAIAKLQAMLDRWQKAVPDIKAIITQLGMTA